MAYVPAPLAEVGTVVNIDVRGRHEHMTVTALPFYRRQR
ncbi:MAG: glycine cleavage T C-terminal barrel domain-containing protein [Demequina sp.]